MDEGRGFLLLLGVMLIDRTLTCKVEKFKPRTRADLEGSIRTWRDFMEFLIVVLLFSGMSTNSQHGLYLSTLSTRT